MLSQPMSYPVAPYPALISSTIDLALPLILTSPVCRCAVGAFLAQFPPFINMFTGLPENLQSNVVLVFAGCPQLTVATGA